MRPSSSFKTFERQEVDNAVLAAQPAREGRAVRRFGDPRDFGGIAVYLMSALSSYHTADCLVIDGGYSVF